MVDNISSCDILFLKAFMRMGIDSKNLKPYTTGLIGFISHEIPAEGMITHPLSIGEWPTVSTKMIYFLIIDVTSATTESLGGHPKLPWGSYP